jgi:hypothetical protein
MVGPAVLVAVRMRVTVPSSGPGTQAVVPFGVITMDCPSGIGIGCPVVLVAVWIGVTTPGTPLPPLTT